MGQKILRAQFLTRTVVKNSLTVNSWVEEQWRNRATDCDPAGTACIFMTGKVFA